MGVVVPRGAPKQQRRPRGEEQGARSLKHRGGSGRVCVAREGVGGCVKILKHWVTEKKSVAVATERLRRTMASHADDAELPRV